MNVIMMKQRGLRFLSVALLSQLMLTIIASAIYIAFWMPLEHPQSILEAIVTMELLSSDIALLEVVDTSLVIMALVASITLSCFLGLLSARRLVDSRYYKHLTGPLLLLDKGAIAHAKRMRKREGGSSGLKIHPKITLPMLRELGNIFVYGMQGSGKSVVIKGLLTQVFARNDKVLIYDEKREYTQLFYRQDAVLISPRDKRSAQWDIGSDLIDESRARLFADAVITDSGNEPFWTDSAKTVVTGVIMCLVGKQQQWGWSELNKLMFADATTLHHELKCFFPPAAVLIEPNNKTSSSIQSVISSQLAWLNIVAEYWEKSHQFFSLTNWLEQSKYQQVIVQGDPQSSAMSSALCNALMSLMTQNVLSLPDDKERRIWLVLDELGNLPKSSSLEKWLTLGRSKGCRTICGTQSVSQLQSIYGDKSAETLLNLFANIVVLRMGAVGKSAEVTSQSLGKRTVEVKVKSVDKSNSTSISYQEQEHQVVSPEQIIHLPQPNKAGVKGFLMIAGYKAAYSLTWPYPKLKAVADGFVERKLLAKDQKHMVKVITNRLFKGRNRHDDNGKD